jgi:hypothetical protein
MFFPFAKYFLVYPTFLISKSFPLSSYHLQVLMDLRFLSFTLSYSCLLLFVRLCFFHLVASTKF